MITKEKKSQLVEEYGRSSKNTGDAVVQVSLLTARLQELEKHFEKNPKDFISKKGFLKMVGQRKRLLKYIKKSQPDKYSEIVKKMEVER
ncbi:MAG: 30S ribosomal protein S15 [Elusimicrobiota bacterium]